MAFDADLAQRVREGLLAVSGALPDEKRMFGGLCFMIAGNMCCGILGDRLMAWVGRRPMKGCPPSLAPAKWISPAAP